MRVWVLLAMLAGCRIGFDPVTGDADDTILDPAMIEVRVRGDGDGGPIANATVLVERGAAGPERLQTDADGSARFASAGVTYVHAIYLGTSSWRVYTVAAPRGIIELGGRPAAPASQAMTVVLPDDGSDSYQLLLPSRCGYTYGQYSAPTLPLSYSAACEGATVHAYAVNSGTPAKRDLRYLDLPAFKLTAGSRVQPAGAFAPAPKLAVRVNGVAIAPGHVGAQLFTRGDGDLAPRTTEFTTVLPAGDTATLSRRFLPGADTIAISIDNDSAPLAYSGQTVMLRPAQVSAATTALDVDARDFLAPWGRLDLSQLPAVRWPEQPGGTLTILEIDAGIVQWSAYLDASATSVTFPQMPALGVPPLLLATTATLTKLEVPGTTREALLRTIDRRWQQWPNDDVLLPGGVGARSSVVYSIGLGPP